MLYIFDKDNTLIGNRAAPGQPPNFPEDQILLPGVFEALADLRQAGHRIAIASNQGGVAWGFTTYERAKSLMQDAARKVGGVDRWMFCPFDPGAKAAPRRHPIYADASYYRKPMPGMLIEIMAELKIDPGDTWMIGDQESDRGAAENAGCHFAWAHEFFGWPPPASIGD